MHYIFLYDILQSLVESNNFLCDTLHLNIPCIGIWIRYNQIYHVLHTLRSDISCTGYTTISHRIAGISYGLRYNFKEMRGHRGSWIYN